MNKSLLELFGKRRAVTLDAAKIPPILRDWLNLTTQSTDCNPGLLITAFLPHLGVTLGNRVFMLSNSNRIFPNIWSCLIGPSSVSRKTTAINYAQYSLDFNERRLEGEPVDVYEQETLLLTNVTLSKLHSLLALNGTRLFRHNELSGWLSEMNKHFNQGYKQAITELYDGVSKTVTTQERTERILNPALSIVTATTEAWMYRHIRDSQDQMGGFLQRFIYFVVRDVNLDDIDLKTREGHNLAQETLIFQEALKLFHAIEGSHQIRLSEEAIALRNHHYESQYRIWFEKNNDELMSYFTRVYDGYFYKFCIIFGLFDEFLELQKAAQNGDCQRFFQNFRVSAETADQCLYLCDFYFQNTIPFLEIVSEQDKLSGERKIVDIMVNKFDGKARHSDLMNLSHMKKREFGECVASLI
ncbi:MAG: DUF3987 domain-containing protein, partial [Desulfobulbus sp.]|nr:DUF3987 domain-containing protein [Desulfobulbus sp.]